MQQLADVVAVLQLPVVTGPRHTVLPAAGAVCHQAAVHRLQNLQRLRPGQLQSPLHKLRVSAETKSPLRKLRVSD